MAQARIALATGGLLGASQPGMSLMDNSQLGASNFQQQITYQRALEGQLAQTIQQIDGVSGAQVQLVLPNQQDQLFGDASPASAAVLLSDSGTLDSGSVRGIARLVSSSVPSLSTSKVTITDSTGALLWPTSDSSDGSGGTLVAKQNAQARYDSNLAAQANAMLASTLGPGKAVVQVSADLNTNQTTTQTLAYAKKGVPLTAHSEKETLAGTGAGATGAAGTASNVPGTTGATTNGKSNYNHTTTDTTYGVGKTITNTTVSPGAINRQQVSVLVDRSVPATEMAAIKSAVAGAVGLNSARGDTIYVGQMAFAKPVSAATPAKSTKVVGYAKYAAVGLGAFIFLLFVGRLLRRREREALAGEPTWLRELDAPRPLAAVGRGADMAALEEPTQVIPLQAPVNMARRQVEDLVDRDSTRVAQQVRAWMSEE
jgi:flagellar M-ring protein FliF